MKFAQRVSKLLHLGAPLPLIPFPDAGTFGLPVELWQNIFTNACASVLRPVDFYNEIDPDIQSPTIHSSNIFTEFFQSQQPALFQSRLSIILVCRSWFCMGISALQSHIYLNVDVYKKVLSLQQALEKNPTFATSVLRLSVVGKGSFKYIIQDNKLRNMVAGITSRLPNLRTVTCPYFYVEWVKTNVNLDICIIYTDTALQSWQGHDRSTKLGIFWQNARTLSYEMRGDPLGILRKQYKAQPVGLANLVNLSLRIEEPHTAEWITCYWEVPKLRTLSIQTTLGITPDWWRFIDKLSGTLEQLELLDETGVRDIPPNNLLLLRNSPSTLFFPKLKSLCISPPDFQRAKDSTESLIDHIRAPGLRQFTIYLCVTRFRHYGIAYVKDKLHSAISTYPGIKKVGFYYVGPEEENIESLVREGEWEKKGVAIETRRVKSREEIYQKTNFEDGIVPAYFG